MMSSGLEFAKVIIKLKEHPHLAEWLARLHARSACMAASKRDVPTAYQ
jgi:hypothetical protein